MEWEYSSRGRRRENGKRSWRKEKAGYEGKVKWGGVEIIGKRED
jgi:hypothetical protein